MDDNKRSNIIFSQPYLLINLKEKVKFTLEEATNRGGVEV